MHRSVRSRVSAPAGSLEVATEGRRQRDLSSSDPVGRPSAKRTPALRSQGVTEALVLAKDRARVRLPMAALRRARKVRTQIATLRSPLRVRGASPRFRQWMAQGLLSPRCGFRSPTKALRRILLVGPGRPPLTRSTRVRIPHATPCLCSRMSDDATNVVLLVRFQPETPLELSRPSRSAPRESAVRSAPP